MNAVANPNDLKLFLVPVEDIVILERYLEYLKDNSDSSYTHARDAIEFFYDIIKKSILEFTVDDARAVVDALTTLKRKPRQLKNGKVKNDDRPVLDSSRSSRFGYIIAWVKRAKRDFFAEKNVTIVNYFEYVDVPFMKKKKKPTEDTLINTTFDDREGTRFLTDEEVDIIMERVRFEPRWFEIFLKVIQDTAWRESEVLTLQNKNINFETTIAGSGNVKNARKEGVVKNPLSRATLSDIKSYMIQLKPAEQWLFPAKTSCAKTPYMSADYVCQVIAKFSKKIGIKFTSHMFRHTASKKLFMKGVDDNTRAILTNHSTGSNVETTVYAKRNITNKDRVEMFQKLRQ